MPGVRVKIPISNSCLSILKRLTFDEENDNFHFTAPLQIHPLFKIVSEGENFFLAITFNREELFNSPPT